MWHTIRIDAAIMAAANLPASSESFRTKEMKPGRLSNPVSLDGEGLVEKRSAAFHVFGEEFLGGFPG